MLNKQFRLSYLIVIVLSMYFGRLGPITVAMILNKPENKKLLHRKFPEGKIYV